MFEIVTCLNKFLSNYVGYPHTSTAATSSLFQPHLRASAGNGSACNNGTAASAAAVASERSRQMGPNSIGGRSRDRSNDSNGHNSDDDTVLSGVEEEDGNNLDQSGSIDGKNKARKKKTRTVFSRSQVQCVTIENRQTLVYVVNRQFSRYPNRC